MYWPASAPRVQFLADRRACSGASVSRNGVGDRSSREAESESFGLVPQHETGPQYVVPQPGSRHLVNATRGSAAPVAPSAPLRGRRRDFWPTEARLQSRRSAFWSRRDAMSSWRSTSRNSLAISSSSWVLAASSRKRIKRSSSERETDPRALVSRGTETPGTRWITVGHDERGHGTV